MYQYTHYYSPVATHSVGEGPWNTMLFSPSTPIRPKPHPIVAVRYSAR